jgi:hypothetical protein
MKRAAMEAAAVLVPLGVVLLPVLVAALARLARPRKDSPDALRRRGLL